MSAPAAAVSLPSALEVIPYDPTNEACKLKNDKFAVCLVIGNSRFQWSALDESGAAKVFWTSSCINESSLNKKTDGDELCKIFSDMLYPVLKRHLFGKGEAGLFTAAAAKEAARTRHKLGLNFNFKIFVLSVVQGQTEALKRILKHLPCTLVEVGRGAFDLRGAYKGMGLDRLCGLYSAKLITESNNVIMIDCGTCTTIQVLSANGVQGGSIQCGLRLQLESLRDQVPGLPVITFDDLTSYIDSKKRKLPLMEKESKNNIICGILGSFRRNIEKYVLDYMKESKVKDLQVVITGGDGIILYSLLADYDGDLFATAVRLSNKGKFSTKVNIVYEQNLLHQGLSAVVSGKKIQANNSNHEQNNNQKSPAQSSRETKRGASEQVAKEVLKKRKAETSASKKKPSVAKKPKKEFHPKDYIGHRSCKYFDGHLYFGKIRSYAHPYFNVVYDDGDSEDYATKEMMKLLVLYDKKKGEDPEYQEGKEQPFVYELDTESD